MPKFNHLDLFTGIGGFHLAGEMVWGKDFNTICHIEIDPFCQKVLKKHWPKVSIISNIKEYKHDGTTIDLLTGGFPRQPFSCAGKQRGKKDDRYLWPEMLRVVSEVHPTWIIGENVSGIINMGLDQVLSDLENKGYACQPFIIPACAVNAPHRRDRVWIVAHSDNATSSRQRKNSGEILSFPKSRGFSQTDSNVTNSINQRCIGGCGGSNTNSDRIQASKQTRDKPRGTTPRCNEDVRDTESTGQQGGIIRSWEIQHGGTSTGSDWLEVATRLCRVDDGIPSRVDRLKSLGNAIVPQVVVPIMQAIKQINL